MTSFMRDKGKRRQRRGGTQSVFGRDRKWENSRWKIGRALSARRRTERLSYWILLAMLGLSSSICPNHFHDLTGRRFRFHSSVKRPRTSKRPIGFAPRTTVHFFFLPFSFVRVARTIRPASKYLSPYKSHRNKKLVSE